MTAELAMVANGCLSKLKYNVIGMACNFTVLKHRNNNIMDDKIKELKDILWQLDNDHNVSVTRTQENINEATRKIVKLFAIPVVSNNEVAVCDHSKHTYFTILEKTKKCNNCGEVYEAN